MSWKKRFITVNNLPIPQDGQSNSAAVGSKFSSYLPEIYAGHPNRVQRYMQYEDMDRDSDISAALDTIADFCTQSEEQNDEPFEIVFNDEASETEVDLLNRGLKKWVKINDFKQRLWHIFRETIKNGDQVFILDPETHIWMWFDHRFVEMVKVDSDTKEPEEYMVKNLDLNLTAKLGSRPADLNNMHQQTLQVSGSVMPSTNGGQGMFQLAGQGRENRNNGQQRTTELQAVEAKHIVHLSTSVGLDNNWPFGKSVLEPIFKVYKQKEMLEDSIIIYRVQRAPERRIFYIDVGAMNATQAKRHIEMIKNEIHQRRIPTRTGGGNSIVDAAFNPLSIIDDYFFAQTAEGRGSKVDTLPGGDNLGEIGDLSYFTKKMARGLRIPTSYLSLGDDDGQVSYNDGKLGSAVIQEFRFNKYCMRLQAILAPKFDAAFKKFMEESGYNLDPDMYELRFNPPQNFAKYRQMELDSQQVSVYQQIADNKKLAERFKLKRYLNLTDAEVLENERLWAEENPTKVKSAVGSTSAETEAGADLSSVGIRGGDDFGDFGDDFGDDLGGDMDMDGGEPAPDMGGGAQGGDAPPPPPSDPI